MTEPVRQFTTAWSGPAWCQFCRSWDFRDPAVVHAAICQTSPLSVRNVVVHPRRGDVWAGSDGVFIVSRSGPGGILIYGQDETKLSLPGIREFVYFLRAVSCPVLVWAEEDDPGCREAEWGAPALPRGEAMRKIRLAVSAHRKLVDQLREDV